MVVTNTSPAREIRITEEMKNIFDEASRRSSERIAETDALIYAAGQDAERDVQISLRSLTIDFLSALKAPFARGQKG